MSRKKHRPSIGKIKNTPMDQLRFRDFAALKVPKGSDEYSRKRHATLLKMLDERDVALIDAAFADGDTPQTHQAAAYRWCLRGLDAEKAIRKVKTDLEIRDNAIGARFDRGGWR